MKAEPARNSGQEEHPAETACSMEPESPKAPPI